MKILFVNKQISLYNYSCFCYINFCEIIKAKGMSTMDIPQNLDLHLY